MRIALLGLALLLTGCTKVIVVRVPVQEVPQQGVRIQTQTLEGAPLTGSIGTIENITGDIWGANVIDTTEICCAVVGHPCPHTK